MPKPNYNLPRGVNPQKVTNLDTEFPFDVRDLIRQGINSASLVAQGTYRELSIQALATEIVSLTSKLQSAKLAYTSKYIQRMRELESNNVQAACEYRAKQKDAKAAKLREKAFARRKDIEGAIYRKFNLSPDEVFEMMAAEFLERKVKDNE